MEPRFASVNPHVKLSPDRRTAACDGQLSDETFREGKVQLGLAFGGSPMKHFESGRYAELRVDAVSKHKSWGIHLGVRVLCGTACRAELRVAGFQFQAY